MIIDHPYNMQTIIKLSKKQLCKVQEKNSIVLIRHLCFVHILGKMCYFLPSNLTPSGGGITGTATLCLLP